MQIKFLEEFSVIGKLGEGESDQGPSWVVPLWDSATRDFGQITALTAKDTGGSVKGVWGLMGNPKKHLGRWDKRGLYLAGCEVREGAAAPAGWTKWTVPAATYLVADCSQSAYGEKFRFVLDEYLPRHGLKMIGAAFEHYPEPNNPQKVELYFPIAKGLLFCQSCGMPMTEEKLLGSDSDGDSNYDYCCYCYRDGKFTSDCTMEEMIAFCVKCDKESGRVSEQDLGKDKSDMLRWFPELKRWKTGRPIS